MQAFKGRAADVERELIRIWSDVLGVPVSAIGTQDHFFSLGGDSLLLTRVMAAVNARFFADRPDEGLAITDFFTHGSIGALCARITSELAVTQAPHAPAARYEGNEIAIIGMACRFPGAPDIGSFWRNVRDGIESISELSDSELRQAGVAATDLGNPRYVKAASFVADTQLFDAEYFGVTAREAALLSPEQRLLVECAEEALQDAGYGARAGGEDVGVFVGTGISSYLLEQLLGRHAVAFESAQGMAVLASNTCAASRMSYLLDLTGPGLTIDTACSSSLVAIHTACRALLGGECKMALAGGASVRRFDARGYYSEEGGIFSPDGHCRPFDQAARGTVGASGAGVVLLKPLAAAIEEGDCIRAIVRGTAVNNDGGSRAGYTAPSAAGQAAAILRALAVSKVKPEQIQYLETHGTATVLGDLIEITALKSVFSSDGERQIDCTLGTLKANVGHLEAAAGVAGLMKVALALEHREMPPAIHFREPAEGLGLEKAAFRFNSQAENWFASTTPRHAGVSSFGIGGTNAHAILAEAPRMSPAPSSRPAQLLVLSARSETAVIESWRRLATHLTNEPTTSLADAAYTLQTGRASYSVRDFIVVSSLDDAVRSLESRSRSRTPPRRVTSAANPPVVYLFPGQGSQHSGMLEGIHDSEPVFREHLDNCTQLLLPHIGRDLGELLRSPAATLAETVWCQPALFAVEYSLAKLWQSWGVTPSLMIGHSLGEYVAACVAGVFTLEDALRIVAARGRLMQGTSAGRMLAVRLNVERLAELLPSTCSVAAINGPLSCVVSGPTAAIERFKERLVATGVSCVALSTSHAFHSASMDGIVEDFADVLRDVRWGEARIPLISNLSGTVIEGAAASSPQYWTSHLRETVNFSGGLQHALSGESKIFLEAGPGTVLAGLVRAMPDAGRHAVVASARRSSDEMNDASALMQAAGELWQRGVRFDWQAFNAGRKTRRVSLPPHPFERQRHWVDAARAPEPRQHAETATRPILADWFHVPAWKEQPRLSTNAHAPSDAMSGECCLLIEGGPDLEQALTIKLNAMGVTLVRIPAEDQAGFEKRLASIERRGLRVTSVVYAAEASADALCSVIEICKALTGERRLPVALTLLTHSAYALTNEVPDPDGAMLSAVAGVISSELPEIRCRSIDFGRGGLGSLVEEIVAPSTEPLIVLRGASRWVRTCEKLPLPAEPDVSLLRSRGVYVVTGGLGGVGWTLAEFLARTLQARVILTGRRAFPDRSEWSHWLETRAPDDPISEKIRAIRTLGSTGAEVLVMSADVSRAGDMERVIGHACSTFGKVDGVIHAAGVPGGGSVFLKTREAAERVLAPKVAGTRLLHEACKHLQLDFFLCCSSLASIAAPAGQYDYCAANAYQDAFCRARDGQTATRFIAIDWDAWADVGMAVDARAPQLTNAISCEEGVEVFRRVLANPRPQWIIDARGLLGRRSHRTGPQSVNPARTTRADRLTSEPEDGVRTDIARIWTELLGVNAGQDDDDFFALGGDSLVAVQLRTRLEEHFSRSVSLGALLRESTLAGMTRLMEAARNERSEYRA